MWYFLYLETVQIQLKLTITRVNSHGELCAFVILSGLIILRMNNESNKIAHTVHTVCFVTFVSENRFVFVIMWKNVVKMCTVFVWKLYFTVLYCTVLLRPGFNPIVVS
jgi:hypothetical protein